MERRAAPRRLNRATPEMRGGSIDRKHGRFLEPGWKLRQCELTGSEPDPANCVSELT